MTDDRDLDPLLLARYATLVALCELLPLPLVDTWLQNRLSRRMVWRIAERSGVLLTPEQCAVLADARFGGCAGMLWAIVMFPVKKLLKTLAFVFQAKAVADRFIETLHRALLVEVAVRAGMLPNGATHVRRAMDAAFTHVDIRPIERQVFGTLRTRRHALNDAVRESVALARRRTGRPAAEDLADAAEAGALPRTQELGKVLEATVRLKGLVPELVYWFRKELGLADAPPGAAER